MQAYVTAYIYNCQEDVSGIQRTRPPSKVRLDFEHINIDLKISLRYRKSTRRAHEQSEREILEMTHIEKSILLYLISKQCW